jgi:murein DD-endopeptidase MepM/ murein hydrolase activator NlpD
MNVIVYSNRGARARQFQIDRRLALAGGISVFLFIVATVFFAGMRVGGGGFFLTPSSQVLEWSRQLETQRAQVQEVRGQLQEKVGALASRVGQMNAQVIRLDALGRRLTEMADLDKGEFNFDTVPAQGGPERLIDGVAVVAPDLSLLLDGLARQLQDRERQLAVLESLISTRNLSRQIVPGGRPVAQGWISSYFGKRADPFTGRTAFHAGLDFAGKEGSEVVAVASGVVTWSKERFGYGRCVEINHGNGYVTRYAHNSSNLVAVGTTVQKGDPIARIGSSGRSTGPHLHFEVLKNGRPVNPMTFVGK